MTTQKTIMLQVGIMKLCNKEAKKENIIENNNSELKQAMQIPVNVDLSGVDSRIANLENKLQRTINAVQKLINNPPVINNSAKNVDNTSEKKNEFWK